MLNMKFNVRRFSAMGIIFCLCVFASCENLTGGDDNANKTKVMFNNLEQYSVTVYRDSVRQHVFAEVAAGKSKDVAAAPSATGTGFYPTFHLNIFDAQGISIPYNGPGIITRIDADKTNAVNIPKLTFIQIDSAFIRITNNSVSSLTLRRGNSEESTLGFNSTLVNSGETVVYQIAPGPSSGYSIMANTVTSVAFPASLTEFRPGIIYVFTYNGTSLTLTEGKSVLQTIPPSAPENIQTEMVSSDSVRITWDAVYGATSYRVYRAASAEGTYSSVYTSASASYTATSPSAGQAYYYKITALSGTNRESARSAAVVVVRPSGAPGNVRVTTATTSSVTLAWNAVSGSSGYNIYRSATEASTYSKINTAAVTGTVFTDTGLSLDTTYWYKVSAIVNTVEGLLSNQISASTLSSVPGNVRITTATTNSVTLAWNAVSGADGYNIYRSDSENGTYSRINTGAVTGTEFTDINVSAYASYFYKVSTVINGIEGIQSNPVSASAGIIVPGNGLAAKLNWLQTNAVSGVGYTVEVTTDEGIGPMTLSSNVTLRGIGATRTVNLSSNGAMFTVSGGVTLVLDNNITLQGRSGNTNSLVRINSGGTLVMNTGSRITGNTSSSYGGGVYVNSGTFTMSGGTISANTSSSNSNSSYGGGVYMAGGTFTMSGGTISTNTSSSNSNSPNNNSSYGGGVYMAGGTFTMSGGTISANTSSSNSNSSNNNSSYGGGVYVNGTFTMNGGTITGNTSTATNSSNNSSYSPSSYGGGVYVASNRTFSMNSGTISGNTATASKTSAASNSYSYGGGVYVTGGTLTMNNGTISGNTATTTNTSDYCYGGGVYMDKGIFSKTNGTIYGYSADDTVNSNVVKNSSGMVINDRGHAIYAYFNSSTIKRKETSVETSVNLSFNGTGSSVTWSGSWDN